MNYNLIIDFSIGAYAISKQFVRRELAKFEGKHVDVLISSPGGDLDHALDIRRQFIDHGDVTVYLSGFVASAATVIAMGAKRIVMDKYAMFLVHKCSNFIDAWGSYNADQMAALIEELTRNKQENDKIDVVLANMYAEKCGKKIPEILDMLRDARWMTSDECLSYGFVDAVSDVIFEGNKTNSSYFSRSFYNSMSLPEPPGFEASLYDSENTITRIDDDDVSDPTEWENNPKESSQMKKKFNFSAVSALLKLDTITPDADGYVSLTAEQFEAVNNQLEHLASTAEETSQTISTQNARIEELSNQIENLKKAPGDTTSEIEDDAGEAKLNATDLFNSVKSCM